MGGARWKIQQKKSLKKVDSIRRHLVAQREKRDIR